MKSRSLVIVVGFLLFAMHTHDTRILVYADELIDNEYLNSEDNAIAQEENSIDALRKKIADFLEAKEYDKAFNVCDKIINDSQYPSQGYFCKSLLYLKLGEIGKSFDNIQLAMECNPDSDENYYQRAYMYYFYKNNTEQALLDLESALEANPYCKEAIGFKARILYETRQYEKALTTIEQLVQVDENDMTSLTFKGKILYALSHHEQAYNIFMHVLSVDETNTNALIGLGIFYADTQDYENAINAYRRALMLAPNNPEILCSMGDIFRICGEYEASLNHFDNALELNPNHFPSWRGKAYTLKTLERYADALEYFQKCLQINENDADMLFEIGVCLDFCGKTNEALSVYKKSLRIEPSQPLVINNAFAILYNAGQYEEVLAFCDTQLQQADESTIIVLLDAKYHALAKLDRHDEANRAKMQVVDLLTRNTITCIQHGLFDDALANTETILQRDPANTSAFVLKAIALTGLERYEDASVFYEKYIEVNPHDALAWNDYGSCLANVKKFQASLDAYDKAIALAPSLEIAHGGKGSTLESMKRFNEALEAYNQAITINPRYVMALLCKVRVLTILEQYEEALTLCDELLRMDECSDVKTHIADARDKIIHLQKNKKQ